jgi:hypothetical protein
MQTREVFHRRTRTYLDHCRHTPPVIRRSPARREVGGDREAHHCVRSNHRSPRGGRVYRIESEEEVEGAEGSSSPLVATVMDTGDGLSGRAAAEAIGSPERGDGGEREGVGQGWVGSV